MSKKILVEIVRPKDKGSIKKITEKCKYCGSENIGVHTVVIDYSGKYANCFDEYDERCKKCYSSRHRTSECDSPKISKSDMALMWICGIWFGFLYVSCIIYGVGGG